MERLSAEDIITADRKAAVEDNYKAICENIAQAAMRTGRAPGDIELVAVTKTVPVELVNHAISIGVRHIGENRVQELASKYEHLVLRDELTVSVIGHLQTNKAKRAAEMADMIQSVDSEHLAAEISARSAALGKVMPCLVEINIGNEVTKSGIELDKAEELIIKMSEMDGIKVCGLMTIPPFDADKKALRGYFEKIHQLYVDIGGKKLHNIDMRTLSMGMSGDYIDAIECGANMVRVGTALFGTRLYK